MCLARPTLQRLFIAVFFSLYFVGPTAPAHAEDGAIVAWGNDIHGLRMDTPTAGGFTAIAAAANNSIALRSDGTLAVWGDPTADLMSNIPSGAFSAVAAGGYHGVGLRADGTLVSWGNDNFGQVSATPSGAFTAVSAGWFHSLALRSDGTLVNWGYNGNGTLNGIPTEAGFVAIAAGGWHNIAMRAEGTLAAWGANDSGQVSNLPSGSFARIASGGLHSIAIRPDGTLVSWGSDSSGQVSATPAGTFTAIECGADFTSAIRTDGTLVSWGIDWNGEVSGSPETGSYTAVAGGGYHAVALRTDGTLLSWGSDEYGLVSKAPKSGPFTAVAAGRSHSIAIRADGTLTSWGRDFEGQVSGTPTGTFAAIAAGAVHSAAIRTDGALVSWGADVDGVVTGTPAGTFTRISAGQFHSVAIRTDGSLVSWGRNSHGQVSGTPTSGTFIEVAAGQDYSVAMRSDGTLVSWGSNASGQITNSPLGVFTAIAAGLSQTIALYPDGTVASSTADFNVPLTPVSAISFGLVVGGAIRLDGTLYLWSTSEFRGMVSSAPAGTFSAIDLGDYHGLAISSPPPAYMLQNQADFIDVGDPMTVTWQAPSGRPVDDWVGLYRMGSGDRDWLDLKYTGGAATGTFTTRIYEPGLYQFRYFLNNSWTKVANGPMFTVSGVNVTLSATPTTATAGVTLLRVQFTAPPGRPATDWIGLYRVGTDDRSYGWFKYVDGAASGTFTATAPVEPGEYEFRYLLKDGYFSVAASNKITVGSLNPADFTLTASASNVSAGGALSVSFTAPGGRHPQDWIGLYKVGDPNRTYGWWRYTSGATSGTFNLNAPLEPGQYEFRYLLEDGYTHIKTSGPVIVE